MAIKSFCYFSGMVWSAIAFMLFCTETALYAQVQISAIPLPTGRVRLSWPGTAGVYQLESTTAVNLPWSQSGLPVQAAGNQSVVELPASDSARFFRLRAAGGKPLTIASTSPGQNETGIAVTRETIFRLSAPLAPDTMLDVNRVAGFAAGRKLLGRVELSGDRRTVTLFPLENLPSDAQIDVTFDGTGLFDSSNLPIDLDADGVLGGVAHLRYQTLSTTALATTGIEGHVFASEKNPDGSNRPLRNVTITVDGMEETLRTTTDTNGFFRLVPSPAGRFFVSVDGRTADGSDWPGGAYYPFVGKAWEAVPGRTNNLAGGSGIVYLPLIQADALKTVSSTADTKITFAASVLATNAALAGVEIDVPANALFSDNGTRGGKVGIAPVPFDRLPEPLPPGLNLPLVITIQTDGARNFDQPVPIKFPNLPDPVTGVKLPPGAKTALWSFNHDTGHWEIQGPATVTADGNFVVSDPGVGVRQPGWHGTAPGGGGGGPGPGPSPDNDNEDDDGDGDDDDCMKDFSCDIHPPGGNSASCLLDCAESYFTHNESQRQKGFRLGLCAGNTLLCPSHYEDILTEKERGCMDACMFPDPVHAVYTIPCNEFLDCSSLQPSPKPISSLAAGSGALPPDRLAEQLRLWQVQGAYLRAVANTPKITETSSADVPIVEAFLTAFDERAGASTPAGSRLSPQERSELLAMPRPGQFSAAEWTVLIDRLDALQAGPLPANVQTAKQQMEAVITELLARGWQNSRDGLRQGFVRRSLAAAPQLGSAAFPARAHFFRLFNLDSGFEQRGRLNSQGVFENIILAPNSLYAVYYFDPITRYTGAAVFLSRSAGRNTRILTAPLQPPSAAESDSDNDQLSDLAEQIVGTSPLDADSDGDGASDAAELANGTNPSDGTPLGLGVVATRTSTSGTATDIDAINDIAVVANGNTGLTVFDVKNPLAPVLLSQFAPVGTTFQSVSMAGEFVAAAPGVSTPSLAGVRVMRLSADGTLAPVGAAPVGITPSTVVGAGRYAYAPGKSGTTASLAIVQLNVAAVVRHVLVPGNVAVNALAIDGDVLWALGNTRLFSFRISGDNLLPLGEIAAANLETSPLEPGLELTAGSGRVYVGGFRGFQVFDGTNPSAVALLYAPNTTQAAIHDLALNGSGLLLPVTSFAGTPTLAFSVYDIRNDRSTNFLASFDTPGTTRAVVLQRGYALLADGSAGIAVANFLPPDRGTNPPTISLRPSLSQADGQEADENFFVSTVTTDDVQVRDVEFYIDGVLSGQCGKFPFAMTLKAPARINGKTSFLLQAKATDTGGNSAWSEERSIKLLPDLSPARVLSVIPEPNSTVPRGAISAVSAFFDSALDLPSLKTGWTLTTAGPDGNLGTADDIPLTGGEITFDLTERAGFLRFNAPLLSGKYRARLASSVLDLSANPLGTNVTWDFTIPAAKATNASPGNGTVSLAGTLRRFELRFDERLTAGSITPSSFQVIATNGATSTILSSGSTSISADGAGAILEFPQPLTNGGYRVVFTREIRDVYGSPVETNFPVNIVVKGPTEWVNDASGFWSAGANWSAGVPLTGDHVIIDRPSANPTVTLRGSATVTTLRSEEPFVLDNAALGVLENAVFNGSFSWNGQATLVGGEIELRGGGVIGGSGNKFFERTEIRNAGVLEWQHGGILSRIDTVFHNLPSGTFLIHKDETDGFVPISGTALFQNEGTLRKNGGVDFTFFDELSVFNTGLVDVMTGTLELSTMTTNAGVIQVAAGAQLLLGTSTGIAPRGGNFTQLGSGRITGQGQVVFGGRPLVVEGTVDFDGVATITEGATSFKSTAAFRAGTLKILRAFIDNANCSFDTGAAVGPGGLALDRKITGNGSLRVEGPTALTRSAIRGALTLRPEGGFVISNYFTISDSARFLNNASGRFDTNGFMIVEDDGVFENQLGATLDLGGNERLESTRSPTNRTALIYNTGLIRKAASTNVARIVGYFQNDGRVTVDAGSIRMESAGVHKGKFEIAAGAILNIADQLNDFAPESEISGAGDALFSARETTPLTQPLLGILRGKINPARLIIQRGTVRVLPGVTLPPTELVSSGRIEVAGDLILSQPFTINSGSFAPQEGVTNATVRNIGQIQLTGSSSIGQGLKLINTSGAQITASREFTIFAGGLLHNQAGAIYTAGGTNASNPASTPKGVFWNEGTFSGTYSNLVENGLIVTNTGLYQIQGGPLRLRGKFHQLAGELRLNGQIELDTGFLTGDPKPLLLLGGTLTGTGSILYTNDSVRFVTNHASVIKPGLPLGKLTIGEDFAQEAAGTLEMELAGLAPGTQYDQLVIPDQARLGGTLRLQLRDGFVPAIGDEFVIITFRSRSAGIETTFQTIEGQGIGGGKRLDVVYNNDRVLVRCVAAP